MELILKPDKIVYEQVSFFHQLKIVFYFFFWIASIKPLEYQPKI